MIDRPFQSPHKTPEKLQIIETGLVDQSQMPSRLLMDEMRSTSYFEDVAEDLGNPSRSLYQFSIAGQEIVVATVVVRPRPGGFLPCNISVDAGK